MFEQVYTIHGVRYNNVLPSVFALLPDKRTETYSRVLAALRQLEPGLNPSTVMTDFEQAQIRAFQETFQNIRNRGCFFHFSQCLFRKIQACPDILAKYQDPENPDFALNIRKLGALAFVPTDDMVEKFEELIHSFLCRAAKQRPCGPLCQVCMK